MAISPSLAALRRAFYGGNLDSAEWAVLKGFYDAGATAADLLDIVTNGVSTIAPESITNAHVSPTAAIAASKLDLSGLQSQINRVFIGGTSWGTTAGLGTPTYGSLVWQFVDAANNGVSTALFVPPHWNTFNITAVLQGNTGVGDIVFRTDYANIWDGEATTYDVGPTATITNPNATNVLKTGVVRSNIAVNPSKLVQIEILRTGAAGGDTLAATAFFRGALLERVT